MKRLTAIFFLVWSLSVYSQNFNERYSKISQSGDRKEMLSFLEQWRYAEPKSIDMNCAYFNYFLTASSSSLNDNEYNKYGAKSEVIKDSKGKVIEYIYGGYKFNDSVLQISLKYIDKAIERDNKRMDLYFKKISAFIYTGDCTKWESEFFKLSELVFSKQNVWEDEHAVRLTDYKRLAKNNIYQYCDRILKMEQAFPSSVIRVVENVSQYTNVGNQVDTTMHFILGKAYEKRIKEANLAGLKEDAAGYLKKAIDEYQAYEKYSPKNMALALRITQLMDYAENYNGAYDYYQKFVDLVLNSEDVTSDEYLTYLKYMEVAQQRQKKLLLLKHM